MRDAENTVKPLKEDKQFPGQTLCTKTAITKAKLYTVLVEKCLKWLMMMHKDVLNQHS